ncbi:MAG TPA: O-antigen ligase family protein [Solirubrobacterales bacterium]|nr:O-antigen ligase family protein [Solirubrobacterales bacterium]
MAALAPAALIGGIALAGGGYDLTERHIAGLLAWLVVVGLLVLGAGSKAPLARPFLWSVASVLFLALWSALSSTWSGSAELSVIEADRALAYLGVFLAAFLIAQTERRRQRFAEGLAIGVAVVVVLGLSSRLLPDVIEVANSLGSGAQLRYPLGYWNANGVVFAIAAMLLLWLSREATWSGLRWLAVATMPAALLGLYFTFSRGGLLALVVSVGSLLALSRDRLWLLATASLAALAAVPAVLAAQARDALEDNAASQAAIDQGHEVLWILLAGTAACLVLFALLRRIERRAGRFTGRMIEASRSPGVLKAVAAGLAIVALVATIAVGGRAWDRFSSSDIQAPSEPVENFSDLSGAGRYDFWRVSFDAFGEEPLAGVGAGSYEFAWEEHREIEQPLHDAHSLYFEAFAELGIVGGLAVLAMVGVLLWTAFAAWRGAPTGQRDRQAALLAAMLAFAVGAAFDWFWEIPGVGVVFFLAAGAAVAARCAQLGRGAELDGSARENRGFWLAVGGLAAAWISAIALIGPLLVERGLDASRDAAAAGNLASAVEHADNARSIEPWAASPYVQLALISEAQRDYAVAAERLTQAIDREDRNWQLYYLRSRVERAAGDTAAAKADIERARQLNPLEECLNGIPDCG